MNQRHQEDMLNALIGYVEQALEELRELINKISDLYVWLVNRVQSMGPVSDKPIGPMGATGPTSTGGSK